MGLGGNSDFSPLVLFPIVTTWHPLWHRRGPNHTTPTSEFLNKGPFHIFVLTVLFHSFLNSFVQHHIFG